MARSIGTDRTRSFESIIDEKPRNYIQLLENYQRLLRLEVDKRRAKIEIAAELDAGGSRQIVSGLERKYGPGLTTEFVVNPELLGGVRVRVGSDVWDGACATGSSACSSNFNLTNYHEQHS